jgi:hypothetical protein
MYFLWRFLARYFIRGKKTGMRRVCGVRLDLIRAISEPFPALVLAPIIFVSNLR